MNLRFALIIVIFPMFCIKAQNNLPVNEAEHNKLTRLIEKGIFETNDEVYTKAMPTFIILSLYLDENRKIENISIQCKDSAVAEEMRKINYSKFSLNWESLIPTDGTKNLINKKVAFYVPIFIIKAMEKTTKPVFSIDDIRAVFLKDKSAKKSTCYIKNLILIKPVKISINEVQ
jgi:hypothetical protein